MELKSFMKDLTVPIFSILLIKFFRVEGIKGLEIEIPLNVTLQASVRANEIVNGVARAWNIV